MVTDLKIDSFNEAIQAVPLAAVLFHKINCPPSEEMLPVFARYSETRRDMQFFVLVKPFGECLFDRFGITGYPEIVVFREGKRLDFYEGVNDKKPYDHLAAFLDPIKRNRAMTDEEKLEITRRATRLIEEYTRPVIFELNLLATVALIAQLQLAFRHPANTGVTRHATETLVRTLIEKVDPNRGDIYAFLMMGFNEAYDE